jgi:hypothetical protein
MCEVHRCRSAVASTYPRGEERSNHRPAGDQRERIAPGALVAVAGDRGADSAAECEAPDDVVEKGAIVASAVTPSSAMTERTS